jgi:hypothetical protein
MTDPNLPAAAPLDHAATDDRPAAPEVRVSRDMVRRGLMVAPVLIAVCAVIWGGDGAWSCAYGIALILLNFPIASGLIAWSARISLALMMGAVLFGYLLRLGILLAAVLVVRGSGWISLPALGATIIVTHLGLLVWELKYVAASLAYPGLKPARP